MGLAAGISSFYLVHKGKLKPNKRFGATPKVFTSSFLSYWAGKISYVFSDGYNDKILKNASDSRKAYVIRKQRIPQQSSSAISNFVIQAKILATQAISRLYDIDHRVHEFGEGNKIVQRTSIDFGPNGLFLATSLPLIPLSFFLSFRKPMFLVASLEDNSGYNYREKEIINNSKERSYNYYSFPLSILCGGIVAGAIKKGLISPVIETNSKWIKKLPVFPFRSQTLLGVWFGFVLGQYLYLKSYEVEDKILERVPDGKLGKNLRSHLVHIYHSS